MIHSNSDTNTPQGNSTPDEPPPELFEPLTPCPDCNKPLHSFTYQGEESAFCPDCDRYSIAEDPPKHASQRQPKRLKRPANPECPSCGDACLFSQIDRPGFFSCHSCHHAFTLAEVLQTLGQEWAAYVSQLLAAGKAVDVRG